MIKNKYLDLLSGILYYEFLLNKNIKSNTPYQNKCQENKDKPNKSIYLLIKPLEVLADTHAFKKECFF